MITEKPKAPTPLSKQIIAKLPTSIPSHKPQQKGEELQKMVGGLKAKGGKVQSGYEGVISSLKGMVE